MQQSCSYASVVLRLHSKKQRLLITCLFANIIALVLFHIAFLSSPNMGLGK